MEERLTPLDRRCLEQEHPYQAVPISKIWINGKQVEGGYSSSSTMSIMGEQMLPCYGHTLIANDNLDTVYISG